MRSCGMTASASPVGFRRVHDLHGAAVSHQRETMMLVERRVLAFLEHYFKEHVVGIELLDAFDESLSTCMPWYLGITSTQCMYASISPSSMMRVRTAS